MNQVGMPVTHHTEKPEQIADPPVIQQRQHLHPFRSAIGNRAAACQHPDVMLPERARAAANRAV